MGLKAHVRTTSIGRTWATSEPDEEHVVLTTHNTGRSTSEAVSGGKAKEKASTSKNSTQKTQDSIKQLKNNQAAI